MDEGNQVPGDRPHLDVLAGHDGAARVVLGLLREAHPGLVHREELVRLLAGTAYELDTVEPVVDDAVAELVGSGLAYSVSGFVVASRAAIRGSMLDL